MSLIFKQTVSCLVLLFCFGTAAGQIAKNLDSLYTTLYKEGNFNGCVLIAENGKPVYKKAFGYADFAAQRPLDGRTMFELASVSKPFTALAIMQLHEQGKLSYADNVNKYFPRISYKDITITDLLHHTSGLREFLSGTEQIFDKTRINGNQDILSALIEYAPPLLFSPAEQFGYCNTNYVLLALIIEKVSGMKFSKYMDRHIFKPLGMTDTKVYSRRSAKPKLENYALGYIYDPAKSKLLISDSLAAYSYQYYFDGVAGPFGISSSVEDMLKWDQALYTEKLLSLQEQQQAYVPLKLNDGTNPTMLEQYYGFGWLISPPEEENYTGKRYMHTGGYPGYTNIIVRYPDKNKTIIILTNTFNAIDLFEICGTTEAILFKQPFTLPNIQKGQEDDKISLIRSFLNQVLSDSEYSVKEIADRYLYFHPLPDNSPEILEERFNMLGKHLAKINEEYSSCYDPNLTPIVPYKDLEPLYQLPFDEKILDEIYGVVFDERKVMYVNLNGEKIAAFDLYMIKGGAVKTGNAYFLTY